MSSENLAARKQPPGCAGTTARLIYFAVIVVLGFLLVNGFTGGRVGCNNGRAHALARVQATIQGLSMAVETYKQVTGIYPPDRATGLHPDLDKPSECMVYYLSGGSICYAPNSSSPDHPWRHPLFQDSTADGTGRWAMTVYYTFNPSILCDTDGDGIPEVVDPWGQPLMYNTGSEANGPFNQNGAPRHNKGEFDIYSAGPDKKYGTEEDIRNWH